MSNQQFWESRDQEDSDMLESVIADSVGGETNVTPNVAEGIEDGSPQAWKAYTILASICIIIFILGIIYFIL